MSWEREHDKANGSRAFLRGINKFNCIGILATSWTPIFGEQEKARESCTIKIKL
jgi:hypothetical protein